MHHFRLLIECLYLAFSSEATSSKTLLMSFVAGCFVFVLRGPRPAMAVAVARCRFFSLFELPKFVAAAEANAARLHFSPWGNFSTFATRSSSSFPCIFKTAICPSSVHFGLKRRGKPEGLPFFIATKRKLKTLTKGKQYIWSFVALLLMAIGKAELEQTLWICDGLAWVKQGENVSIIFRTTKLWPKTKL